MSQLIALQTRNPRIDLPGAMGGAERLLGARQNREQDAELHPERLKAARTTSQLNALKLSEQQGKHSALEAYRSALESGEENPEQHLRAYPELENQYQEAFDSITDRKEKRAAAKRAKAIGEAARELSHIPEGPLRQQVGEQIVDHLVKEGHLSPELAQQAKENGFTDVLLEQYLPLADWVDRQFPDIDEDLKRKKTEAEIDYKQAQTDKARRPPAPKKRDVIDIERAVSDYRKAIDPHGMKTPEEIEPELEAFRQRLLRDLGDGRAPEPQERQLDPAPQGEPAPQSEAAPAAVPGQIAPGTRARNPSTGQVVEWNGQEWVMVSE